jgi:hypothetical protein
MTLSSWFDVSVIVGHLAGFCLKMAGLSHGRHRTGLLSLNTVTSVPMSLGFKLSSSPVKVRE